MATQRKLQRVLEGDKNKRCTSGLLVSSSLPTYYAEA